MKRLILLTLVGLFSIQTSVLAGLFDDDKARQQIAALKVESHERLQQLEMANRKMLDLANHVERMQAEIAQLKGRVDELNYSLESTQKRQQDLYVDLDSRMNSKENQKPVDQTLVEEKTLNTIANNVQAQKYKAALFSLQKFIANYPESKQMGAAYYWLGMSYAGMKQWHEAELTLHKVMTMYPEDPYAPNAMLALASVQLSQENKMASNRTLQLLIQRYKESSAAQQAKRALTL